MLTVSMNATQAGGCRIVDRKGRNLISRDEAITRCRLTWVVRDVTWDAADVLPVTDTLARALTRLPLRDSPDGAVLIPSLAVGTEVVVVGQTGVEDGVRWYAVTPADQAARAFGWVPFRGSNGTPTLRVVHPDCPSPGNWAAVSKLTPGRRFVCFGSRQFTVNLEVVRRDQPPDGGVCEFTGPAIGCVAGPAWLTDMSGVAGFDPLHAGRGIDLRIDPTRVERDAFPTTPTVMGVTGSFGSDEAYECTVHDSETGRELLADVQAIAHCNQQFVVTALGSPAPWRRWPAGRATCARPAADPGDRRGGAAAPHLVGR